MAYIDYYQILDLKKNATEKQIKQAYRKLARKYHPDVNPNDKDAERKFKEVNEANEVLSDPENRKKYDEYGKDWKRADQFEEAKRQGQNRRQQQPSGGQEFTEQEFSEFFESMFGGGRSSGGRRSGGDIRYRGQDYQTELQLSLSEVFKTHKRTLTINGKNIRLAIPAGVKNGQVIKIKGHGGKGMNSGPNGDLHITFHITNDTTFNRDGDDLNATIDLDLYKAVLGGELMVNTFDGKAKLKVGPGTRNGTKVKLKGKGFPKYKQEGKSGDLFITYRIDIPTNLSDKEKKMFEELSKLRAT